MARRSAAVAALFAGFAVSPAARASAFDVFGFGPAGVAEVNARAARADDGTATFYNPGGLGLGRGHHVELSLSAGVSALRAQGEVLPLQDPLGLALALDATIPFEGPLKDRIRFGFGGYFPLDSALRLIAQKAEAPVFPYYDNRTQRLVFLAALAVKITERAAIGAGVNGLGGVSGAADVRPNASGAPEPRINVAAATRLALNAGLRIDPAKNVRLGLTYRSRFAVPALIATSAEVGGVPLDVTLDIRDALFDPATLVIASSFDVGRATFELDALYSAWSGYAGPLVVARAELPGVRVVSEPPRAIYRDVVSARAAATYRLEVSPRTALTLRAGGGLESSMVTRAPQGRTNIVDGGKVLLGLGATLALGDVLPMPVWIGAGASASLVSSTEQTKRACPAQPCLPATVFGPDAANPSEGITNPGYPKLEAGGAFWSMSLGVGVAL